MIRLRLDHLEKFRRQLPPLVLAFPMFFLFACATAEVAENPALAKQKYKEAVQYSSLNLKQEMYANLQEAAKLAPEEPNYHLALGTSYFADGDLEKAENEFLETLRLNKNFVEAHKHLGRLYMQREKWGKAIHHFRESLKNPGVSSPQEVHNWLALCYYTQNDFNRAEQEWLQALHLDENPAIRLNLALAYRNQERFGLALGSLQKALSADPELVEAHHLLALLLLKKKDMEGAREHFERVIQLKPQSNLARDSKKYMKLIRPQG